MAQTDMVDRGVAAVRGMGTGKSPLLHFQRWARTFNFDISPHAAPELEEHHRKGR